VEIDVMIKLNNDNINMRRKREDPDKISKRNLVQSNDKSTLKFPIKSTLKNSVAA